MTNGNRKRHELICDQLTDLGYVALFEGGQEEILISIWNEPQGPGILKDIVSDKSMPGLARFIAAEMLFDSDDNFPAPELKQVLIDLYVTALSENFTEVANTWGLPGIFVGFTGEHVFVLGEGMVPALEALLDNSSRVYYEGSKESTMGHAYQYRVKDIAAYLIAQIKDIPLDFDADPAQRDIAISNLKEMI